jgi:hypothetical protein
MVKSPPLHSLVFLAIGAASAILGLLPWIVTGMRLPLQNLWATGAPPGRMPIALLPFSQYSIFLVAAVLLIGATIAGIAGRAVPARHPGTALLALLGGVLLVQVIATVQTAVVVGQGLNDRPESKIYLVALVGGSVIAILLGVGLLALIARAPRAGALIALSIAAIAFSSWLGGIFFPMSRITTPPSVTAVLGEVMLAASAVIVGVAIAWCGVATVGRVIAALVSLALLWTGPALVTAVSAASGSRVLAHYPSDMVDQAVRVFGGALFLPQLWLPSLALAIVVAAIGLVARRVIARRSPESTTSVRGRVRAS